MTEQEFRGLPATSNAAQLPDTISPHSYELTQHEIACAFNEWLARYIADPAGFEATFQTVVGFHNDGDEPSYGADCAVFLLKIHNQLKAA